MEDRLILTPDPAGDMPGRPPEQPDAEEPAIPPQDLLTVAMDVGEAILHYGGDVHRVEDTMTRICTAYGASRSDVFVITSLITAAVTMPDGSSYTLVRRIKGFYNHLARLEEVNALSRAICRRPLPLSEVRTRLDGIRSFRPVPEWLCYVGAALATAGFAVFFGGGLLDGCAAGTIALLLTLLERGHSHRVNAMARAVINAFIAGVLSVLCVRIGFGSQIDKIISGTIMLEIPGLSFGNALRDMLWGDTISGTLRLIQALLQALMMALGYLAALALCGLFGEGLTL